MNMQDQKVGDTLNGIKRTGLNEFKARLTYGPRTARKEKTIVGKTWLEAYTKLEGAKQQLKEQQEVAEFAAMGIGPELNQPSPSILIPTAFTPRPQYDTPVARPIGGRFSLHMSEVPEYFFSFPENERMTNNSKVRNRNAFQSIVKWAERMGVTDPALFTEAYAHEYNKHILREYSDRPAAGNSILQRAKTFFLYAQRLQKQRGLAVMDQPFERISWLTEFKDPIRVFDPKTEWLAIRMALDNSNEFRRHMFYLLYYGGFRPSELCQLTLNRITDTEFLLYADRETGWRPKKEKDVGEGTVPIHEKAKAHLNYFLKLHEQPHWTIDYPQKSVTYVNGPYLMTGESPYSLGRLNKVYQANIRPLAECLWNDGEKAKAELDPTYVPKLIDLSGTNSYTFRHSFATHMLQEHRSFTMIAKLLRNSREVCENHYARFLPETKLKVMDGLL